MCINLIQLGLNLKVYTGRYMYSVETSYMYMSEQVVDPWGWFLGFEPVQLFLEKFEILLYAL